jgi:hypothetical protein
MTNVKEVIVFYLPEKLRNQESDFKKSGERL